jgi:hypothetical protein
MSQKNLFFFCAIVNFQSLFLCNFALNTRKSQEKWKQSLKDFALVAFGPSELRFQALVTTQSTMLSSLYFALATLQKFIFDPVYECKENRQTGKSQHQAQIASCRCQ